MLELLEEIFYKGNFKNTQNREEFMRIRDHGECEEKVN